MDLSPLSKSPLFQRIPGLFTEFRFKSPRQNVDEAARVIFTFLEANPGVHAPPVSAEQISKFPYLLITQDSLRLNAESYSRPKRPAEAAGADPAESKRTRLEPSLGEGDFNLDQWKAVCHGEGPMMVLAGPGSGKTRVIVGRILRLIGQGVDPDKIVAVTFTKKAAREMKERLARYTPEASQVTIKTFHSLGMQVLRRFAKEAGRTHNFKIFDEEKAIPIIGAKLKYCVSVDGLQDNKEVKAIKPLDACHMISYAKCNRGEFKEGGVVGNLLKKVLGEYNAVLAEQNAFDFADLIVEAEKLLQENDKAREHYQKRWLHVLVDEYQDTSPLQDNIANALAGPGRNLFVVGDPKQSIYGWRGATPNVMEQFRQGCKGGGIELGANYRCAKPILAAAQALMKGTCMAESAEQTCEKGDGDAVTFYKASTCKLEAHYVVTEIKKHIAEGKKHGEIAVLFRTNAQETLFREACAAGGIPYLVRSKIDTDEGQLFKEPEIVLLMKLLAFVKDPTDKNKFVEVLSEMVVDSKKNWEKLLATNRYKEEDLMGLALRYAEIPKSFKGIGFNLDQRKELGDFVKKLQGVVKTLKLDDAKASLEGIIEAVGYGVYLKKRYPKKHPNKQKNVDELLDRARGKTLEAFFRPETELVHLMTLHCAKGLEFKVVFLVGMEEGILPHYNATTEEEMEEERRLCYVGITRAEERLYLTHAASRHNPKSDKHEDMKPSPFLDMVRP